MATIAHLSHYDLVEIGRTNDNILFSGNLAACKRMAAAHGMEIEKYEGYVVGNCSDGSKTPTSPTQFSRIWFIKGGMIQRCQDDFTLVMPLEVWNNK